MGWGGVPFAVPLADWFKGSQKEPTFLWGWTHLASGELLGASVEGTAEKRAAHGFSPELAPFFSSSFLGVALFSTNQANKIIVG